MEVHNVDDRRFGWIGSWTVEPLNVLSLTDADIGRTVIYQDHGRAQAGTLTSWKGNTVFARYSRGDTSAGSNASDLVFGIHRADRHPSAPPDAPPGKSGIFRDHSCWKCREGAKPCAEGSPNGCGYPVARNH